MLWSIKINCKLHYYCLPCYELVRILLAAADDNGSRFSHHCCRQASLIPIKHRSRHELINFYINLLNPLNRFDSSLGKNMLKAAHPSAGGVGSSNPRRRRGWRLHHHGGGV